MTTLGLPPSAFDRLSAAGEWLVRSRAEIVAAMRALCATGDTLTAEFEHGETLFSSRVLAVDLPGDALLLAWSGSKRANARVLASPGLNLHCHHAQARIEFRVRSPHETQHAGAPAVAVRLPRVMLVLHRRATVRVTAPQALPLRCRISVSGVPIDAALVDASPGGIGALVYEAGVDLKPGTHLTGVRIALAGQRPFAVDLEVRHSRRITLRDGRFANRAGCRLHGSADDLARIVAAFVTPIDDD